MIDETLILIENYLTDALNKEDRKVFEKRLETDKDFHEEFELYKNIMGGLRLRNNKLFKNRLNEIHQQEIANPRKTSIKPIRWKWAIAIAASILLIMFMYNLLIDKGASPSSLYASHFERYEPDWRTRGTEDELVLTQVKQLYESQNYKELKSLFADESIQRKLTDVKFIMIQGISNLETGHYKEARRFFKRASENPLVKAEAQWYMALSYLKEEDIESCEKILKQFSNDKSSDYYEEASDILKGLGH